MKLRYWGTRGSIPTIGDDTKIYGGNTPCVSLETNSDQIILDAGSGIRELGASLAEEAEVHILLTHYHLDHIQGLGFFKPLFRPNQIVHIWGPSGNRSTLRDILNRYLSPPLFPVRIRDLSCDLRLHDLSAEKYFQIGDFTVEWQAVVHRGLTVGYRINADNKSITYLPDHEPAIANSNFPADKEWTSGFDISHETDILIHDGQYSKDEYVRRRGWGHSSMEHAIQYANLTGAAKLHIFHHDPMHSDAELLDLFNSVTNGEENFKIELAREGEVIEV